VLVPSNLDHPSKRERPEYATEPGVIVVYKREE